MSDKTQFKSNSILYIDAHNTDIRKKTECLQL